MQIHTFRAKSMPQALDLVRQDLGPDATVLHTRELNTGLVSRMFRGKAYEVAATHSPPPSKGGARGGIKDDAPSETHNLNPVPSPSWGGLGRGVEAETSLAQLAPAATLTPPASSLQEFQSLVAQLRVRPAAPPLDAVPHALADIHADLLDADVDDLTARDLLSRLVRDATFDPRDSRAVRRRLAELVEAELAVTGPLRAVTGAGRVVALVGPTGVGKTTTIAKLAANYRLKENRRVGLLTVDTYRIAAVEQLRTYAEIIDLPMEVFSTPREVRAALARMRDFDLVLMDTAGRSPRDEVRIRELRAMLAEAEPDEVHLVLSAASSARGLLAAAEKFGPAGVTALLVTKLDEATGLGSLLALSRASRLPFSYTTDGQNVPDDIAEAQPESLANLILGLN